MAGIAGGAINPPKCLAVAERPGSEPAPVRHDKARRRKQGGPSKRSTQKGKSTKKRKQVGARARARDRAQAPPEQPEPGQTQRGLPAQDSAAAAPAHTYEQGTAQGKETHASQFSFSIAATKKTEGETGSSAAAAAAPSGGTHKEAMHVRGVDSSGTTPKLRRSRRRSISLYASHRLHLPEVHAAPLPLPPVPLFAPS